MLLLYRFLFLLVLIVFQSNSSFLLAQSFKYLNQVRSGAFVENKKLEITDGKLSVVSSFQSPHPIKMSSSFVSDENGNVLLYSNGCYIYNAQHDPLNSTSLQNGNYIDKWCSNNGSIMPQSHLFIRRPDTEEEFYFFYYSSNSDGQEALNVKELRFLTINSSSNAIMDDKSILSGGKKSNFDISLHENGKDYWLAVADLDSYLIKVFLITNQDIIPSHEVTMTFDDLLPECKHETNLQFSKEGNKLMVHVSGCYLGIYDFDQCFGELAGPRLNLNTFSYNSGAQASFSEDGKYILLHRDIFIENAINSGHSEILLFNNDKIGVTTTYESNYFVPPNFAMGRIISDENYFLIFNRFSDRKYLKVNITDEVHPNLQVEFVLLPFWYSQGFSRPFIENTNVNNCTTPVTLQKITDQLKVYPNPASEFVYFSNNENNQYPLKVSIFDIKGKQLCQLFLRTSSESIDVTRFSAGLYILKFEDNNKNKSVKSLIIQN